MIPTSDAQYAASASGSVPPLEQVRDDLWIVPIATGYPVIPHYTLTALLLRPDGGVHVVDPGVDSDAGWATLRAAFARIGRPVSATTGITITHLHPDHLGLTDRLRAESGAEVSMHRLDADELQGRTPRDTASDDALLDEWGVPAERRPEFDAIRGASITRYQLDVDRRLDDGDSVAGLRVLHTPGHTPGSISLRSDDDGLIFTGDHLLPTQFPGIGLGGSTVGNPIGDYFGSLERLLPFDGAEVLPGHGYRFRGLRERVLETEAHHLKRSRQVQAALAADPGARAWEVAALLSWTAGWENLHGIHLYSALAQTEMHREFVQAGGLDGR